MKNQFLTFCFLAIVGLPMLTLAQSTTGQLPMHLHGTNAGIAKVGLRPVVNYRISPNESEDEEAIEALKEVWMAEKYRALANGTLGKPVLPMLDDDDAAQASKTATLFVSQSFDGNYDTGSCPTDNTMAISASGYIVSAINNTIEVFLENGTSQGASTLYDFFTTGNGDPLSPSGSVCDPKVVYDRVADRFIFFAQVCDGSPTNSRLLLAFSSTGNPTQPWYLYSFYGNLQNVGYTGNATWFDYPKMAYTASDILVTGNMYTSAGSYETSAMYVFDKSDGYTGQASIGNYVRWGLSGFTFVPLQNAGSSIGNSIWLVSKTPGAGSLLKFYKYDGPLPGNLGTMPYTELTTDAFTSPPDGIQPNSSSVALGDGRMMDGYLKNGIAHFVFSESYLGNGAIRYYRVDPAALTGSYARIFSNASPVLEFGWPCVVDYGASATDQSSIVGFQSVSNLSYPGFRAKYYDNSFATETSIQVIGGQNSFFTCSNSPHRWGDYTSAVRKPGSSSAWVFGSYGLSDGTMGNRIAEIGSSGVYAEPPAPVASLNLVYPNPASDQVTFQFQSGVMPDASYIAVDMAGTTILSGRLGTLQAGEKSITLDTKTLPAGMYNLRIVTRQAMVTHGFGVVR